MTRTTPRTLCVMAVHNGASHLAAQLHSMADQTMPLDRVLVIDDRSTDATPAILAAHADVLPLEVVRLDAPLADDALDRIGANFRRGLELLDVHDGDVVLFADQDDVWEPHRVARQTTRVAAGWDATAAAASCIDADGVLLDTTLTALYPRPDDWRTRSVEDRLRAVLTAPLATGASMAVSGSLVRRTPAVPAGWLHDRWYSLAAAAAGGLDLDAQQVVRYRLHGAQSVGSTGSGAAAARARILGWVSRPASTIRRVRDITTLRTIAPARRLRVALGAARVVLAMLDRRKWGVA